jgi:hypothetical protein
MLGFVPQTPLALSRGTRPTQWLPNLHGLRFLGKTYAVLRALVSPTPQDWVIYLLEVPYELFWNPV